MQTQPTQRTSMLKTWKANVSTIVDTGKAKLAQLVQEVVDDRISALERTVAANLKELNAAVNEVLARSRGHIADHEGLKRFEDRLDGFDKELDEIGDVAANTYNNSREITATLVNQEKRITTVVDGLSSTIEDLIEDHAEGAVESAIDGLDWDYHIRNSGDLEGLVSDALSDSGEIEGMVEDAMNEACESFQVVGIKDVVKTTLIELLKGLK